MKLAIISHTAHYRKDNKVYGWGPTIREVNHLMNIFDEIWHIGFLHEGNPPKSALMYTSNKIHFVPLKAIGGSKLKDKLDVLYHSIEAVKVVNNILKKVDYWQFRAPTGIGMAIIPNLTYFIKKPGWFKYAGSWVQKDAPFSFRIQRQFLAKYQNRPVTINGFWENQPSHCLSFENPCLTIEQRVLGKQILEKKNYDGKVSICFVGRLEEAKGVQRILNIMSDGKIKEKIAELHLVGDGPKRKVYEEMANHSIVPVHFHGFLKVENVYKVMAKCQLFLLPSDSEGFPKVVAEACNFGCIPVVSKISSIPHYVNDSNGFLWDIQKGDFKDFFFREVIPKIGGGEFREKAKKGYDLAEKFTFKRYNDKILDLIGRFKKER